MSYLNAPPPPPCHSTFRIIQVTEDDIRHGVRGQCQICPIAKAVQRALNLHLSQVKVDEKFVAFYVQATLSFSDLPPEASKFIVDFDKGWPVEPFAFVLDVPHEVL